MARLTLLTNYSTSIIILKNNIPTVPIPTITANGPLTFSEGGTVTLSAHPDTGYTYQWFRDSVMIKNATTANLNVMQSGNYKVSISADSVTKFH